MLVYQKFKFIGFQKKDDITFLPLFNNEQETTITLPLGLVNKKYIINFNEYINSKSHLEESGFVISINEKTIEESRLFSYIKIII